MKSNYKILVLIFAISVFSCNKELRKPPIGLLTPDQINTDPTINTVNSSVTSSYQMLSNTLNILNQWRWDLGTVFRDDIILQDMASDDVMKKWNPDGDQAWMDQISSFNYTASNPGFNGQWSYDYEGISRSNLSISYLTDPELATIVREGDVVLMPAGYHPNVAAPGGQINFLWMMAANREDDDRLFGVVNVQPEFAAGGSGLDKGKK